MNAPVRWREETGFELRCPDCRTFWPLDLEFWMGRSMQRCRGCENDRRRAVEHQLSWKRRVAFMSPEARARKRIRDNERRRREREDPERGDRLRERERINQQRFYGRNPELNRERRRAYYARKAAEQGREVRVGHGRPRLEDAA